MKDSSIALPRLAMPEKRPTPELTVAAGKTDAHIHAKPSPPRPILFQPITEINKPMYFLYRLRAGIACDLIEHSGIKLGVSGVSVSCRPGWRE